MTAHSGAFGSFVHNGSKEVYYIKTPFHLFFP